MTTLNGSQIKQLADLVCPDEGDEDQLDTEVTIEYFDTEAVCPETGEKRPQGYYAWLTEYPEEGYIYIPGAIRSNLYRSNDMALNFEVLRKANTARGIEWCGRSNSIEDMEFCAIELGGETGEALDAVKKFLRHMKGFLGGTGGAESRHNIAEEIADVIISADRLAETLNIDLEKAVKEKFNKTSAEHGLKTTL